MRSRWRILLVVTQSPVRGPRLASSFPSGYPPRHVATLAARLLALGAEVRVLDQDTERLPHRVVRREARLWRADLVLLHAGGNDVVGDPIPDERPLAGLLAGWTWEAPVLATGPLARAYGAELLQTLPRLAGLLLGPVSEGLLGGDPLQAPGVARADGLGLAVVPADEVVEPDILPAWQTLPLESYGGRLPDGLRTVGVLAGGADVPRVLAEVRHAVHRAGARFLIFEDPDLGLWPEVAVEVSRAMFGAAPNVPWAARVRADRVDRELVLALARGGCAEVLVTSPAEAGAPAQPPMDDPARPRLESAVDAIRVTGLGLAVEHVVGRPGHTRAILSAWQRWFADRGIAVRPHVRLVHAGDRGPGRPTLEEARSGAGCWDNELLPADVERAVRQLGGGRSTVAGASS